MVEHGPFGARVYKMNNKTILVYQTTKRGVAQNAPYVVFPRMQEGVFVDINDDKAIADAIRDALNGKLP
jgi:hypothetical protein